MDQIKLLREPCKIHIVRVFGFTLLGYIPIIIHTVMNISISLAQMKIHLGAVAANVERAKSMIVAAKSRGSHLVLLPELWTSGYDLEHTQRHARTNLDVIEEIASLAAGENIWIGGSYILERNAALYNTFVLLSPDGSRWQYEKIHLFRLMDEHLWLNPGDQMVAVDIEQNPTGLAICYDLRFPEIFRHYATGGAQMIVISAEWPAKRVNHWQVLLRARAIENQVFMAAVNSVGETGGEIFGGCSAIVSPAGEVLAEGSAHEEELLTAAIDLEEVAHARAYIPILSDRRPDIYG
jgi:omega-amidase